MTVVRPAPDPGHLALRNVAISISALNVMGYTALGFEQPWTWPFLALLVGYAAEALVEVAAALAHRRRPEFLGNGIRGLYRFLLPAHITALVVNMLLYANDHFAPVAFAVVVAVGQKAVLRAPIHGRLRHFMNPSSAGITAALLSFPWVNIAPPYHFTEHASDVVSVALPVVVVMSGTLLNAMLTRKVPLIAGWLGSFVAQALMRNWLWDVALWAALAPITGVALILFTNYMITDPGTTPTHGRQQVKFGASVGMVYGVLMVFNIVYTVFFAVTIVCLLRGLMWWVIWLSQHRRAVLKMRPGVDG